jgi:hypothetical protein
MPHPPETIVLYFDGACRRGAATVCASGVFWERYDNKHSRGRILPNAKDSMEAEIYAATHAIITAQIILKEEKERSTAVSAKKKQRTGAGINTFVFLGDSMVIAKSQTWIRFSLVQSSVAEFVGFSIQHPRNPIENPSPSSFSNSVLSLAHAAACFAIFSLSAAGSVGEKKKKKGASR